MEPLKRFWAALARDWADTETPSGDAKARGFLRLFKSCPICGGGDFIRHQYVPFATTLYTRGNKGRIERFLTALEERDWPRAVQYQDWEPLSDDLEAYAFKCSTGKLALVTILSPFELYDDDHLIRSDVLSTEEGDELVSFVDADKWKPLA